jgi:hypothetical protein
MKNYPVEHVRLLLRDLACSSAAPSGRPARLELRGHLLYHFDDSLFTTLLCI